jgi:thiol-disulfide isomerase/thioredoxin
LIDINYTYVKKLERLFSLTILHISIRIYKMYLKLVGIFNISSYIGVMNKGFVELVGDDLSQYISNPKLLVVYSTSWCKACKKIKPQLQELGNNILVVQVDTERHLKSNRFFPTKIKHYPTLAYYENGYFIEEIDDMSNISKEISKLN